MYARKMRYQSCQMLIRPNNRWPLFNLHPVFYNKFKGMLGVNAVNYVLDSNLIWKVRSCAGVQIQKVVNVNIEQSHSAYLVCILDLCNFELSVNDKFRSNQQSNNRQRVIQLKITIKIKKKHQTINFNTWIRSTTKNFHI